MVKFFIGIILGLIIAGGLAYYLNKTPPQFINKAFNNNTSAPIVENNNNPLILAPSTKIEEAASSPQVGQNASGGAKTTASSASYDFYDILPGKKQIIASGVTNELSKKTTQNMDTSPKKISKNKMNYYIQVGAYTNPDLANNMKANLALLGIDSTIKTISENHKTIHKVIINNIASKEEANSILEQLDTNNITGTILNNNQ